ncbi:MAG TPA: hypothetical protein VKW04_17895 [Planctomycetota bacterium]|nr:hypothetical protein [Planctomycetota bacterium]
MNDLQTTAAGSMVQQLRQRFWMRLRSQRIIRASELIRVHRYAQQRCLSPEEAIVALGLMTEAEVINLLTRERHEGAALASA